MLTIVLLHAGLVILRADLRDVSLQIRNAAVALITIEVILVHLALGITRLAGLGLHCHPRGQLAPNPHPNHAATAATSTATTTMLLPILSDLWENK